MIEQLFNEERRYGEPVYSQMAAQITEVREELSSQMDDAGRAQLWELDSLYNRQSSAMLKDAYVEGFSSAIRLMMEVLRR